MREFINRYWMALALLVLFITLIIQSKTWQDEVLQKSFTHTKKIETFVLQNRKEQLDLILDQEDLSQIKPQSQMLEKLFIKSSRP